MKASKLLEIIRENLKDYDIEYVRNKVTDDRYKDPLTKKLAKYNSETYDDIYGIDIVTSAFILTHMPAAMRKPSISPKTFHCILH